MDSRPDAAPRRYTPLQVALHWIVVGLLALQFLVNSDIRIAFRQRLAAEGALWPSALWAGFHIVSGCLILGLMLLRLRLRIRAVDPPPPEQVPRWLHAVAQAAHLTLYALVIGMALAGIWAWFGASPIAATLHEIGRLLLIVLLLAHIAGALIEHHLLSNPVLHHITGTEVAAPELETEPEPATEPGTETAPETA